MNIETAYWIFFVAAAGMALIWLLGTRFAYARARMGPAAGDESAPALREEPRARQVTGEAVLPGDPETLSKRIAELLAGSSLAQRGGAVKITERTAGRVAFAVTEEALGSRVVPGEVTLEPQGGGVRLRYAVDLSSFRTLFRRVNFLVCFVYCGLFVIGVPLVIWRFVLPSEEPAVRYQVFQIFQMVHGVWPPFLLGTVWSRLGRRITWRLQASLENLRHLA